MKQPLVERAERRIAPARPVPARTGVAGADRRSARAVTDREWQGDPTAARPERALRTVAAVVVGVLVVLSAATWSLHRAVTAGPPAGPGELAVDGGLVRVDGVVSAAAPRHAMPGMGTDDDPVAEGHRRISVELTLLAGDRTMRYEAGLFGLLVDGEPADRLTHRDVLPGDALPADTRLSGTIMFDVPEEADAGVLTYDGTGAADLVLPAEEQQSPPAPGTTDEDHDGATPHGAHDGADDARTAG